jgi:predicted ATPase
MLIELSVANFRSFHERVTLSLEAEPRISERDKAVDERNVAHTPDGDLLRVVGIYGANASGKSNLITALATLRTLVLNSAREGQMGDELPAAPFRLDPETLTAPSEIEVVFVQNGLQVRYGAAFTIKRIERDWLFVRLTGAEDEERWFERTQDSFETSGAWVRDPGLEQKTRDEALHISAAAAWKHAQAQQILAWFKDSLRVLNGVEGNVDPTTTINLLDDQTHKQTISALIRRLDFGIDDLRVESLQDSRIVFSSEEIFDTKLTKRLDSYFNSIRTKPARRRLVSIHQGIPFDLATDESAGTIKAVALAGPIVEALAQGSILVIDEFDARLHTLLAKQLVELFQDPLTNPHDAQLVFTSHDTNLLTRTLLRRDQFWFVEKSHKTHASDLYSLAEFRLEDGTRIRNDARYEVDYLQGKYGAIPFFGNLKALLGEALAEPEKD